MYYFFLLYTLAHQIWETVEPYMLKYEEEEKKSTKITGEHFQTPDSPTGMYSPNMYKRILRFMDISHR